MKLSIRWVIILGCFVLVWGTHLIITPSSYILSERVLSRHMQDIMENISDLTLEQSYNHLSKAQSAASLAKQLLSSNVVSSENAGTGSLERYFFDQLSIYPHLSGIYVGGLNGNFIMVSRHFKHSLDGFCTKIIKHTPNGRTTELIWRDSDFNQVEKLQDPEDTYNPRTLPWFKKVMEQKQICWTAPYIVYTTQNPGVTIAGPCFDNDHTLTGIVGVDIEISELSTFISRLRVGKSGKAFIMNENGDIIAFHDLSKLIVPVDKGNTLILPKANEINDILTQKAFSSIQWNREVNDNFQLPEPTFSSFAHSGKKYLTMFTPFPEKELPWIIGVYIPEDDYLGILKSNRMFNIVATVFVSLVASLMGLIIAEKIVAPVESLTKEANAVKEQDMKTTFSIKSSFNELQKAADSFARMKNSLIGYEGKLHESESLYRAIAKTANDAIVTMDHNHCISFLNPAAEKMFGYTKKEAYGMDLHKLLSPKRNTPLYTKGLTEFVKTGRGPFIDRTVNVIALDKFGLKFPVELSLSSLQIDGKWHAVAIIRNITERKRAEQLRRRLADDLHDGLGGSLTNIKLFAEMTKAHSYDENTQKNLDAIAEISADCLIEIRNYMNILDEADPRWDILIPDLNQYCSVALEPRGIMFSMTTNIKADAPPPTRLLYINIQKIIKEAVTNVIKHCNGNSMHIDIKVATDRLQCTISDNGTVGQTTKSHGRGLLSMTSRAKEMGGILDISWKKGLFIMLDIPFSKTTVPQDSLVDDSIS